MPAGRDRLMDGFGLRLPTIQNWSCHSCSECCTRHVVEITEDERQRILDQGWSDDDEFTEGTPVMVRDLGPFWNRRWRLGQQSDGACVFLDDLGINLKPARAMGMHTIKVGNPDVAIAELEDVLGLPLR